MKTVIFGAGMYGKYYIENCPTDEEIVAICDNNWEKQNKSLFGHKIVSPEIISQLEFDRVLICVDEHTPKGIQYISEIRNQLLCCISIKQIVLLSRDYGNDLKVKYPRIEFLRELSKDFIEMELEGNVAECGVCWGDYAVKINEFFPEKRLFLFDTFSSFDSRDFEQEIGDYSMAIDALPALAMADPEIVFLKMPYKENVVIKQGYIPETFTGLDDEKFCFVNLDMDLYAPTLASLRFFADKMVVGGKILVHDYYQSRLDGVKRAVLEFAAERNIVKTPIGDMRSVAITIL